MDGEAVLLKDVKEAVWKFGGTFQVSGSLPGHGDGANETPCILILSTLYSIFLADSRKIQVLYSLMRQILRL